MIVEQDDRRGAAARRLAEHFARMHDTGVERADREQRRAQDAALRVEQHDAEMLDGAVAELGQQQRGGVARRDDLRPVAAAADERAAPRFDRGDQLRGAGNADAGYLAEIVGRRAREAVQAVDRVEHRVREFEGASARRAVTEHDRQQLVVAERGDAGALQLLTRTIVRRDGLHRTSYLLYFHRNASPAGDRTPAAARRGL